MQVFGFGVVMTVGANCNVIYVSLFYSSFYVSYPPHHALLVLTLPVSVLCSHFSSMVIRDLTLRSAASFGSFHLIRLLYDEYMYYLIEHRVAQAKGETPIAVMGEVQTRTPKESHSDITDLYLISDILSKTKQKCLITGY